SPTAFCLWKKSVLKGHRRHYTPERLLGMKIAMNCDDIVQALESDLEELFQRVERHNLPYAPLYDELFSWFTHARGPMAKQILITNRKFYSYCPSLSMGILRLTSNLHPNLRLSSRFINNMFRDIEELKNLSTTPTSQAPLIPFRFPDFFKYPVWGLRSK